MPLCFEAKLVWDKQCNCNIFFRILISRTCALLLSAHAHYSTDHKQKTAWKRGQYIRRPRQIIIKRRNIHRKSINKTDWERMAATPSDICNRSVKREREQKTWISTKQISHWIQLKLMRTRICCLFFVDSSGDLFLFLVDLVAAVIETSFSFQKFGKEFYSGGNAR